VLEHTEVTIDGKTYTLGLREQEQLERLLKGFQHNLTQGISSQLTFDGEREICLWTAKPDGMCGLLRIEEKGEEVNAGTKAAH